MKGNLWSFQAYPSPPKCLSSESIHQTSLYLRKNRSRQVQISVHELGLLDRRLILGARNMAMCSIPDHRFVGLMTSFLKCEVET